MLRSSLTTSSKPVEIYVSWGFRKKCKYNVTISRFHGIFVEKPRGEIVVGKKCSFFVRVHCKPTCAPTRRNLHDRPCFEARR